MAEAAGRFPKACLDVLSDGVIAVIITIMALDLKASQSAGPPRFSSSEDLSHQLCLMRREEGRQTHREKKKGARPKPDALIGPWTASSVRGRAFGAEARLRPYELRHEAGAILRSALTRVDLRHDIDSGESQRH